MDIVLLLIVVGLVAAMILYMVHISKKFDEVLEKISNLERVGVLATKTNPQPQQQIRRMSRLDLKHKIEHLAAMGVGA